jgi:hypothetical protein
MMGIFDSKRMWASNVSFLNDRRELQHGLESASEVIKKFSSQLAYSQWSSVLKATERRMRNGEIPNTYAVCFCEKSDLLSQWRGYGGNLQGISITFDYSKLAKLVAPPFKASLSPVVYGKLKTKEQINLQLSEKLDDLEEAAPARGLNETEKKIRTFDIVSRLLPQFKHIGFQDEREWRIVVQHKTLRSEVQFRASGNVVVPYINLDLAQGEDLLPIKYIRIGPGKEQELTKRSIELYLESKGYEIDVRLSAIPYRF